MIKIKKTWHKLLKDENSKIKLILFLSMVMIAIINIHKAANFKQISIDDKVKTDKSIAVHIQDETGEYSLSNTGKFPTEGYVLNSEKSGCNNGGMLSQDAETKAIGLKTSNMDVCNLYFDKAYEKPVIVSVDFTESECYKIQINSITLEEEQKIDRYVIDFLYVTLEETDGGKTFDSLPISYSYSPGPYDWGEVYISVVNEYGIKSDPYMVTGVSGFGGCLIE